MLGPAEQNKVLERARLKSLANLCPGVPGSLKLLRQRDQQRYVRRLIEFFQTNVDLCHPSSDVGWWCCYEEQMKDLVTFLSEPHSIYPEVWSGFREDVSNQLSLCRQCAIAYHKAVNAWELSNEVSRWPKEVVRRRVTELVQWDAHRLVPAIEKGVICSRLSDDPRTLAARTQCREAFLESLLTLRLCMHDKFCEVLGKVFRTRSPARNHEEVAPYIKAHGAIPPGVTALCFHSSEQVRKWAKSVYLSCRSYLPADEQAVQLLISKGLRLAVSRSSALGEGQHIKSVGWAPDLRSLWEGLDTLLTSISSQELESMMKRNKKFPIMEAIFSSLTNAGNDFLTEECHGLPLVLSSLHNLLVSIPFACLFAYCKLTPEKLLDAVFKCFKSRSSTSCEKRKLLDMMLNISSASTKRGSKCDSNSLFMKCFSFLEGLEFHETVPRAAQELEALNTAELNNIRVHILTTGARLLLKFYWRSWPRLPVDDSTRIADFVTRIVQEIPGRECTWDLLRNVLLTDVFNLMRCIYGPQEVEMIATAFFAFHAAISTSSERRYLALETAVQNISRSQVSLTWVEDLWQKVKKGCHVLDESQRSEKECDFEMSLILDLHRLVGVLDPQRCGDLLQNKMSDRFRSLYKDRGGGKSVAALAAQRMETIHETIVSRMKLMLNVSNKFISYKETPFHAAHLLSSSRREVSNQALLFLQRRCKIQNATFAKPQSRDKLLVHILKQSEDDSRMVFDGFMSATRVMSAQGAAISVRAYPAFFRWYSLLTSRDCPVLRNREVAKGALGVLLTFLENWHAVELTTSAETFREAVCRLFCVIPSIWDPLHDIDIEGDLEKKSRDDVNHHFKDVGPWVRRVVMKLLAMHNLSDGPARGAWMRMITHDSVKLALKSIDSYRDLLLGIISENETRRGPLEYVQCRKLAESFDLEEASQILDRWTLSEARRTATQTARASTTRNYRETKIDNFFSTRPCRKKPFELMEGNASSAMKERYEENRLQKKIAVMQKRNVGHCSTAAARANGSLHDLRRDHRQARAEIRRVVSKYETSSREREPTKTRFELLREERIAEKERKKSQIQDDGSILFPSEMNSEGMRSQGCMDHLQGQSAKEGLVIPEESPDAFSYPKSGRDLGRRCVEQIKRDVLMSQEPHSFEIETYLGRPTESFDSVESYVSYWEPLLITEFRASMRKKVDEERVLAEQNKSGQEDLRSRMLFAVDGPAEDIGYLHTLSVSSRHREAALQGYDSLGISAFDAFRVQVSDIVQLEIPKAGDQEPAARKKTSEIVFAIVSTVLRSKKEVRLTLHVIFDNTSAPGKGRLLRVSKLLSFATLQRQLDALWSLPKMQDGILWSLLDPIQGWCMQQDLQARDEVTIDRNSLFPQQVIQKMETLGTLNASQGRAIADVVRSCSCLFASRGGTRSQYTSHNHGGMSLIQGPPGTGKTTTIIALLSALFSCLGSNPYRRKAKVVLDGTPHVLNIPAIRILVCAPSNAAVDELMLRVMNDGLFTASENRVCPRLVRVGRGTTVDALKALEVHSLSKSEDDRLRSREELTSAAHDRDHRKLLEEVNRHIGELDGDRRKLTAQLERASDEGGVTPSLSKPDAERLREIGERLNILHDKKKFLHSILTHVREAEKTEEASRKRENLKTMCNTLATASVVFATLSSSGHEDMKSLGVKFDIVIIDEAGQSCEPETLIPITLGQHVGSPKQRFIHTVLVGDPKQLPATVLSRNRRVATKMGRSLFERIGQCVPSVVHLLDIQYRMHPKISSFPNERFYGGLLRDSANVRDKNMSKVWHLDKQKRFGPLTFFDTARTTKETRSRGGSLRNDMEAKLVIEALVSMVRLYRTESVLNRIVVLSPYKEQVVLLRRLVSDTRELREAKAEVSTIDGIQGREKSVVILSTVRSGHSKDIGFVKDDRRLNVALTRAKHTLMIFGHADFLSSHSDSWAALISHCRRHSQVVPLTDAYHPLFPEFRSFLCQGMAKVLPSIDLSNNNNDDHVGELPVDQVQLSRNNPMCDVKDDALVKESSRTVDCRDNHLIEKLSSHETDCGRRPIHRDGPDRRIDAQSPHPRLHDRLIINRSMVVCNDKDQGEKKASEQQDDGHNPSDHSLNRASLISQPTWQHQRREKQKGDKEPSHRMRSDVSPDEQSFRLGDPRRTNIKLTGQRHMNALVKTRGHPPLARKSFEAQGSRAPSCGDYGRVDESSHEGSSPCRVQGPSHVGTQKHLQDCAVKRSTGNCNTAPKQTRVPASPIKRSNSSRGESLLLNEPPPKRSRIDKERHRNQGPERKNFILRGKGHRRQNGTNSFVTQRRALQNHSTSQTRRQATRRLVTHHHHHNRSRQNRNRQTPFPNPDVNHHQSQTNGKTTGKRTTPTFSLADTQTRLKGTLDTARKARGTGAPR